MSQPEDPNALALRPAEFGPYFRVETETQTADDAAMQERSNEIWGRVPFGSAWPQVQAIAGTLPDDVRGIEFYTDAPPDPGGHLLHPRWSGRGLNPNVRTEGEFAKISCVIVKNTQR